MAKASKAKGERAGKRRKKVRFGQLNLCDAIGQLSFRTRCTPHGSKTVSPAPRFQVTGWICHGNKGETRMVEGPINIIRNQEVVAVGGRLYDVKWVNKTQVSLTPREE